MANITMKLVINQYQRKLLYQSEVSIGQPGEASAGVSWPGNDGVAAIEPVGQSLAIVMLWLAFSGHVAVWPTGNG